MNLTFCFSTFRDQWSWKPRTYRDGPRTLRNGRKHLTINLSWLCFFAQIDNER